MNCLFTASKSARALTARSVWSIWLIWFVLFIWLSWFIWLISFNQKTRQTGQTKQRSSTCAGRLFQHPAELIYAGCDGTLERGMTDVEKQLSKVRFMD